MGIIAIAFAAGVVVGAAGGYTISVSFSNKSQKSFGAQSPNVMGDGNTIKS
jgi:hypothetical protein